MDSSPSADAAYDAPTASLDARVDEIFDRLLDLPEKERAQALQRACAAYSDGDQIRETVERLLAWSEEPPGKFGTSALLAVPWAAADSDPTEPVDHGRIGPYRILGELGRGGMGVVYLAQRDDGHFTQRVALKVVRPGNDNEELRHRFEQERQIIASLNHPHIARLFDGGVTEDGRPYSAMELVEGLPITEYCDKHQLDISERLRLFEKVGSAVHYAHQNLVVHRDLKPSNILVDADGEIKLLDFGIAKLLDLSDTRICTRPAAMTRTGRIPMTPLYASPEQLRGEPVTTVSDVYQLGLLLFELVTGERARDESSLTPISSPQDTNEESLPAPSSAIRKANARRLAANSKCRATTPRGLLKALRGDLDTIVLTALHPELDRRYPSAAEMVEDLKRYRRGFALSARRDSLAYRSRRFLKRNRVGVGVAATFLLLLVGYAITVTIQAERISRERDRAERVLAFALGLYSASDPHEALGPAISAGDLVDRGVERLETELHGEPDIQSELMIFFARVYERLGRYDESEDLFRKAIALRVELHGETHIASARPMKELGQLLVKNGDPAALPFTRKVLELQAELFGEDHPETSAARRVLSMALRESGQYEEAEEHLRRALEIHRREDPKSVSVANDIAELSWLLKLMNRREEAESLAREALTLNLSQYGDNHPVVATAWNNLANSLWELERWAEGDEAMEKSLETQRNLYGDMHPHIATSLGNFAGSQGDRGDFERAADFYRQALEMRRELLGPEHLRVAQSAAQLGETLHQLGRLAESLSYLELSLEIFQANNPDDQMNFARVWRRLGHVRLDLGKAREAEEVLEKARLIFATHPTSDWASRIQVLIARSLREQGRFTEAAERLETVREELERDELFHGKWLEEKAALETAISSSAVRIRSDTPIG